MSNSHAKEQGSLAAFNGKTLQQMLLSIKSFDKIYKQNAIKGFLQQLGKAK